MVRIFMFSILSAPKSGHSTLVFLRYDILLHEILPVPSHQI